MTDEQKAFVASLKEEDVHTVEFLRALFDQMQDVMTDEKRKYLSGLLDLFALGEEMRSPMHSWEFLILREHLGNELQAIKPAWAAKHMSGVIFTEAPGE